MSAPSSDVPHMPQGPTLPHEWAPVNAWVCDSCGRPWVKNFEFAHAADCPAYQKETATQYADYQRLLKTRRFVRPMTNSEWGYTLILSPEWLKCFKSAERPTTLVSRGVKGRHRIVTGFDPDQMHQILTEKENTND